MARIEPLTPPYESDVHEQLTRMMPPGVDPIGLFRTFARNMAMTTAMNGWGGYELGRTLSLSKRHREIVIDRVTARCGCEYEWGVMSRSSPTPSGSRTSRSGHSHQARAADDCWDDPTERLLIEAVDSLHDTSDIDDELFGRLGAALSDAQLLDLFMLTGWYHAISFCARAARVDLEPGAPTSRRSRVGRPDGSRSSAGVSGLSHWRARGGGTGMTMTAATTWVNTRTSLVPVVVDPASAGGTSETPVSTTAVTVNVCAGRFAQRVMATAITIPTAVQISVATAKPRTGMGSAVSAPNPPASIETSLTRATAATSSVATAAATPAKAPTRSSDRRDGAAVVSRVSLVNDAVVRFMAVLPCCRGRPRWACMYSTNGHRPDRQLARDF